MSSTINAASNPIRSRTKDEQAVWPNRGAYRESSFSNKRSESPATAKAEMLDPEELPW
ncbi:hypothetical protein M422DRAFT_27591 [Sphaerobolus stellatus SS14]|nr:hypothetical protein M422DRAFT_27591 [Sphaerobolus stellatus SS14]